MLEGEGGSKGALFHRVKMPLFSAFNGDVCVLGCSIANDAECPCSAECVVEKGAVPSPQCRRNVKEWCCKHPDRCNHMGHRERSRLCLPFPEESLTYQGTTGVPRTTFGAYVIHASVAEDFYPAELATAEPDWEAPAATCPMFPYEAYSINGWVPALDPYLSGNVSDPMEPSMGPAGKVTAPVKPNIILGFESVVDVTSVVVAEASSLGNVRSVSLLVSPIVTDLEAGELPKERDFTKEILVYDGGDTIDPEKHPLMATRDVGYHGAISHTTAGLECLSWGHNFFDHPFKPESWESRGAGYSTNYGMLFGKKGDGVAEHNRCRNPDQDPNGAWCYVWDETDVSLGLPQASLPHNGNATATTRTKTRTTRTHTWATQTPMGVVVTTRTEAPTPMHQTPMPQTLTHQTPMVVAPTHTEDPEEESTLTQ